MIFSANYCGSRIGLILYVQYIYDVGMYAYHEGTYLIKLSELHIIHTMSE